MKRSVAVRSVAVRSVAVRSVCFISFFLLLVVFPIWSSGLGVAEQEVMLSFALPAGESFHYKTSSQTDQNFFGMDITVTQSGEVDLSLADTTEEGNFLVSLTFKNIKAGMVRDDELEDYDVPIKLEGSTVNVAVSSRGEVVDVEAAGYIEGLRKIGDLEDIVDIWFVTFPDTAIAIGGSWREEIEEQGNNPEGEEPEIKGWADYTLKKIEEKMGIEVALIEGKIKVKIHRDTPAGTVIADGEGKVKAYVAVDGGYVVESKETMEVTGKIISKDDLTGRDKETDTAMSQHVECKLQK